MDEVHELYWLWYPAIMMDDETYAKWWPLHVRQARGECLKDEEQQFYQAGLHLLESSEVITGDLAPLRQARAALEAQAVKRLRIEAEIEALDAQITQMERALSARDRELLGIGS